MDDEKYKKGMTVIMVRHNSLDDSSYIPIGTIGTLIKISHSGINWQVRWKKDKGTIGWFTNPNCFKLYKKSWKTIIESL